MADGPAETKVSYPYMSAGQWFGVRAKLRQSLPSAIDVDWVMAALGTSEKGGRNIVPQLKAVGLLNADGKPSDLALDLRDDNEYASACQQILENLYPEPLRAAWDNPDEDPGKVAAWFMRNAGTGATTAANQAKLYLTLLKGELPSAEDLAKKPAKKAASPAKKASSAKSTSAADTPATDSAVPQQNIPPMSPPGGGSLGPNLHIDMQIHISADASDNQIDTIFKSMAKHLYGRA